MLAHAAHWATTLAFFGPVVVQPLALWGKLLLDRRRERAHPTTDGCEVSARETLKDGR